MRMAMMGEVVQPAIFPTSGSIVNNAAAYTCDELGNQLTQTDPTRPPKLTFQTLKGGGASCCHKVTSAPQSIPFSPTG